MKAASEDGVEAYLQQQSAIKEFRSSLSHLVSLAQSTVPARPVVFFIDDLDRCKPSYAVQLLERIKHLFDVPGIVFVLSLDKQQLVSTVKGCYGPDLDGDGYIRRFLDLEYALPDPPKGMLCRQLAERYGLKPIIEERAKTFRNEWNLFIDAMEAFVEGFSLSSRQIYQLFAQVNILLNTLDSTERVLLETLPMLLVIKAQREELYRSLQNRECSGFHLIQEAMKLVRMRTFLKSENGIRVAAKILGSFTLDSNAEKLKASLDLMTNTALARSSLASLLAKMEEDGLVGIGWDLIARVELATPFSTSAPAVAEAT